jgi:hypothetical protein
VSEVRNHVAALQIEWWWLNQCCGEWNVAELSTEAREVEAVAADFRISQSLLQI